MKLTHYSTFNDWHDKRVYRAPIPRFRSRILFWVVLVAILAAVVAGRIMGEIF